jgi:hypothetical protein
MARHFFDDFPEPRREDPRHVPISQLNPDARHHDDESRKACKYLVHK